MSAASEGCEWTPIYRTWWNQDADAVLDKLRADGFRAEFLAGPDGDPPRQYWNRQMPKVWIGVPAEQAERARTMLAAWEATNEARVASPTRALRRLILLGGPLFAVVFITIRSASDHGQPGLALGLAFSFIAVCVWAFIRAKRRTRRVPPGLCPRCHYDLRGNVSAAPPSAARRDRDRRRRVRNVLRQSCAHGLRDVC
jgi:hypothetical protein